MLPIGLHQGWCCQDHPQQVAGLCREGHTDKRERHCCHEEQAAGGRVTIALMVSGPAAVR